MTTGTLTYREALRAFADGKTLERKGADAVWNVSLYCGGFNLEFLDTESPYRIRQATITINGVEVPEPLREAPPIDAMYYTPEPAPEEQLFSELVWGGDKHDIRYLKRGLVHLTKEAAEAHARALILASGGQV